jgi:hypothetical protein
MARQKSEDKITARGVGLKVSEWRELEKIAAEVGTTPHAIAAYGIRYFVKDYQAGKVKTQSKKVPSPTYKQARRSEALANRQRLFCCLIE